MLCSYVYRVTYLFIFTQQNWEKQMMKKGEKMLEKKRLRVNKEAGEKQEKQVLKKLEGMERKESRKQTGLLYFNI